MKKILYMSTIAALAFVSCAKDSTTEVNKGRAIDFRVAATRTTEPVTTDNLESIWVTAVGESGNNHFSKVNFVKNGSYFTTDNEYYWPSDGSNLTFYAYAPADGEADVPGSESLTLDATTKKLTGFSPADAVADQIDFVFAVASGNKENAENGVELIFDHALTQVEINAFSNNTGYKHLIKGLRIGKVVSKGDFDFNLKTWDLADEKSDYEILFDEPIELASEKQSLMGDEGNAMLIPQQLVPWDFADDPKNEDEGTYFAVLLNVTTADGAIVFPATEGNYEWVASTFDTEWVRGFKYVYNLDFTNGAGYTAPDLDGGGESVMGGKISFTHSITSWSLDSSMDDDHQM